MPASLLCCQHWSKSYRGDCRTDFIFGVTLIVSVETQQVMWEEISQVTSANLHPRCQTAPMYSHFFIILTAKDALLCSLSLILTQLFTHPLVQLTKGTNKTHPVWPVLHATHTVSTTLSPAQTFYSLEQWKRQSACPNTKTQAPKQIRSCRSLRQGALGEGKVFAASFFLPAPSTFPNILQSQHRLHSWRMRMSKNSGICRDRHTAASEWGDRIPTRSWYSASLFALQQFLKHEGACKLAPTVPAPQLSSSRALGRWLHPCTAFLQHSPSAAPCLLMCPLWVSSSWQG